MHTELCQYRFVARALPIHCARPREFAQTMPSHLLSYMELPYDPEYNLYNDRLALSRLIRSTSRKLVSHP